MKKTTSALYPVVRRPQRTLTPEERELVKDVPLLNFQGGLFMGIIDPVPNASPMSEDEGAWVREQVWPGYMQEIERKYPFGFWRWSHCERGTCWNCLAGRCDLCVHRQEGGPHVDDNIDRVHGPRGLPVAKFIPRPNGEACVWWCRCACPKTDSDPAESTAPTEAAVAPAETVEDHPVSRPGGRGGRRHGRAGATADEAQYTLF
ncbi:DUF6248 family natural product biosynthesis protein [Streptomyces sp. NPDC055607]